MSESQRIDDSLEGSLVIVLLVDEKLHSYSIDLRTTKSTWGTEFVTLSVVGKERIMLSLGNGQL